MLLIGTLVRDTFQAARSLADEENRYLALACFGAEGALLSHSLVDFNLYIPANAMFFAWICAIGGGLQDSEPSSLGTPLLDPGVSNVFK